MNRKSPALLGLLLFSSCIAISGASASAQDTIPSRVYFAGYNSFYEGDYRDAMETFQAALRGSSKIGAGRWIDAICYHTMIGECLYRTGRYPEAMEEYNNALRMHIAFAGWQNRLIFSQAPRPGGPVAAPWGPSTRPVQSAVYPKNAGYRIDTLNPINQGGDLQVMQQSEMRLVQAEEIVRCTALAVRRRMELLGPLCPYDPLTADFLAAVEANPGPANHWSRCWSDGLHALALLAMGKTQEAVPLLGSSEAAMRQFDHVLTSTILLEKGRILLESGDYKKAAPLFFEASVASYHYFDGCVLEDALRLGAVTHLASHGKGVYPPLAPAMAWARADNYRNIGVSCTIMAAECELMRNQTKAAAALLSDADAAMTRTSIGSGTTGARWDYVRAMAAYQDGAHVDGAAALASAMQGMLRCSPWVFQIAHIEGLYNSGRITTRPPMTLRAAMELYTTLLRDPTPVDWSIRPTESLAVQTTPHSPAYEHWFLIALQRNDRELAFEIADRGRRHRFYNTLPFAGRMLSLRNIVDADPNDLAQETLMLRNDLLTRYPAYKTLADGGDAIRRKLEGMPIVPPDEESAETFTAGLSQWSALSVKQEAALRAIALRREYVPLSFPPIMSLAAIRSRLPEEQALLLFYQAGADMYAILLNAQDYDLWKVRSVPAITRLTGELLREMGHFDRNRELDVDDLAETEWKVKSAELLNAITSGSRADFAAEFPQLVIVPDGVLWYVPFEALHVKVDDGYQPLITRFAMRYAPLASLAVPGPRQGRALTVETVVEVGTLFPKDEPEVAQKAFLEWSETLPNLVALHGSSMPAPTSVYGALVRQLVVLDDIDFDGPGPYAWSPIQMDHGKPGNFLSDWLSLPMGGPSVVVLPGFHTTAEDGFKRLNMKAPGHEVFLSVCALMANGADTILISRWRPGGKSTYDLVRDFLQKLPEEDAAIAWRMAVYNVAAADLDVEREPRVKRLRENQEAPKSNHPFFWAGFLLVDRGQLTEEEELEQFGEADGEDGMPDGEGMTNESDADATPNEGDGELQFDPIDGSIITPSDKSDEDDAEETPPEKQQDIDGAPDGDPTLNEQAPPADNLNGTEDDSPMDTTSGANSPLD